MLTTLAKCKAWLGIPTATVTDDALLAQIIADVEQNVLTFFGREIAATVHTGVKMDGSGTDTLRLQHYPIIAVTELRVDSNRLFALSSEMDLDDIEFDSGAGLVINVCGVFPCGRRNVRITYEAGYETLPADLDAAIQQTVADYFTRAKQLAGGQSQNEMSSENIGGERSESYRAEMHSWGFPKTALATLQRYRPPGG